MTSLAGLVDLCLALAGFVWPAWPIWRIRRWYVAIPISALLSCWLLATLAILGAELTPEVDNNFGAGMMVIFSPGVGLGYALFLFALRAGTRTRESSSFSRRDTVVGLAVWICLCVFAIVIPFIAPPRARRGDPLFLGDYFFYCGPILLLALTMSLVYLWRLVFTARGPTQSNGQSPGAVLEDVP